MLTPLPLDIKASDPSGRVRGHADQSESRIRIQDAVPPSYAPGASPS